MSTILNGVAILELDYALAVKIHCVYLRAEDRNGIKKRDTDAADIVFIGQRMLELGQQISDTCAERFKVGYYHMVYVRQSIGNYSDVQRLIAIGLRKLLDFSLH